VQLVNETILVVGYGSLLSGYGLLGERRGANVIVVGRAHSAQHDGL